MLTTKRTSVNNVWRFATVLVRSSRTMKRKRRHTDYYTSLSGCHAADYVYRSRLHIRLRQRPLIDSFGLVVRRRTVWALIEWTRTMTPVRRSTWTVSTATRTRQTCRVFTMQRTTWPVLLSTIRAFFRLRSTSSVTRTCDVTKFSLLYFPRRLMRMLIEYRWN